MLDNSKEAIYKMELESYKARQLYSLLKDQQPIRLEQMKKAGTLIPLLNETARTYQQTVKDLIGHGTALSVAEEIAWTELATTAGL